MDDEDLELDFPAGGLEVDLLVEDLLGLDLADFEALESNLASGDLEVDLLAEDLLGPDFEVDFESSCVFFDLFFDLFS